MSSHGAEPTSAPVYAVHAACIRGVEAVPVTVEVSMGGGLPSISIVGMADSTVLEALKPYAVRVQKRWIRRSQKSITINLAPSDMRKSERASTSPSRSPCCRPLGKYP